MAGFFEPGREAESKTTIPSAAKRQAVLAILQALGASGREIGGYGGKRGKPGLKLDLGKLIELIATDPNALVRRETQTRRPPSPSAFQNVAGGVMTLEMLSRLLRDDRLGQFFGENDAPGGSGFGMWPQDMGDEPSFDFGNFGSSDGTTYGVNQADAGPSLDDLVASWWR